jgi:hypothetical protein
MYKAWEFALLVAVCFLLICYVLHSDALGLNAKLAEHVPVSRADHEYNMLYKGFIVGLSALVALSGVGGKAVLQQQVMLSTQ